MTQRSFGIRQTRLGLDQLLVVGPLQHLIVGGLCRGQSGFGRGNILRPRPGLQVGKVGGGNIHRGLRPGDLLVTRARLQFVQLRLGAADLGFGLGNRDHLAFVFQLGNHLSRFDRIAFLHRQFRDDAGGGQTQRGIARRDDHGIDNDVGVAHHRRQRSRRRFRGTDVGQLAL